MLVSKALFMRRVRKYPYNFAVADLASSAALNHTGQLTL